MDKLNNIDDFFRAAREQQAVHSFDAVKVQFIASSMQLAENDPIKKQHSLSLKKWIMTFTAITSIIVVLSWIYFSPTTVKKEPAHTSIAKQESTSNSSSYQQVSRHFISSSKPSQTKSESAFTPVLDVLTLENTVFDETPVFKALSENPPFEKQLAPASLFSDEEPLPKLTEKEIAFAEKTKKQLLKALNKRDKKEWAYIPAGSFRFQDTSVSVQSFFMLKTEVTNAQYLAFIYDLIIQNKKEAFYKAKPDQKQWNTHFKASMEPFVTHYFSHPAYANFPVVNVSPEGAELFCQWINEEYKKMYSKAADQINPVRLPLYAEWGMAATCGGKYSKYPWAGESVKNENGLMQANFVRTDLPPVTAEQSSDHDLTASAKSYWPNDFGIYNLAGNVAEMVVENTIQRGLVALPHGNKSFRTVGGSYEKSAEYLEIDAKDPYEGKVKACPAIGFRIVMTHLGANLK